MATIEYKRKKHLLPMSEITQTVLFLLLVEFLLGIFIGHGMCKEMEAMNEADKIVHPI